MKVETPDGMLTIDFDNSVAFFHPGLIGARQVASIAPRCLQAAPPAFHRFDVAAGAKSEFDIDNPKVVNAKPTAKAVQQPPQLAPCARQRAVPSGLSRSVHSHPHRPTAWPGFGSRSTASPCDRRASILTWSPSAKQATLWPHRAKHGPYGPSRVSLGNIVPN